MASFCPQHQRHRVSAYDGYLEPSFLYVQPHAALRDDSCHRLACDHRIDALLFMVNDNSFDGADITFFGKIPGEKLQCYFRQHWARISVPFLRHVAWNAVIVLFAYISFFIIVIDDAPTRHMLLVFFLLWLIGVHAAFLAILYRYFLYVIVITDQRVHRIKKTFLVSDDVQNMDLLMLQDIEKKQHGIVQKILGYGTIVLEARDTVMRLHYVPRIDEKYIMLMHLRGQTVQNNPELHAKEIQ